ncbi:MAG: acyl-ACP--UDP-N-acetylglucosamine O-acyltransferase [Phycisphaerales bacterium]|nr:acyl-ACP--UDP-N-acetylglucosamine O-acyltransferase [Phycisphaerales bacterium]
MSEIHPSAIVGKDCELGDGVVIGPYCVLQGRVKLAAGVRLIAAAHLSGPVEVGEGTEVYPGACLGFPGQDVKFKQGMPTAGVRIGKKCIIREHVTVHAATNDQAPTTVGDRAFLMACTHLGHDARIGNDVTMVNGSGLAGHAEVGDNATLSGGAVIHQFTRVGRLAFLSGGTGVSMDVPPFCMVPERQRVAGINLVGMRRNGISREEITRVREAFRLVFRPGDLSKEEMIERLESLGRGSAAVLEMARFVRESKRAICPGPGRPPRLLSSWLNLRRRGRGESALDGLDEAPLEG